MVPRFRICGEAVFLAAFPIAGTQRRITGSSAREESTAMAPMRTPASVSVTSLSSGIFPRSTRAFGSITAFFSCGSTSEPPAITRLPSS